MRAIRWVLITVIKLLVAALLKVKVQGHGVATVRVG